MKPDEEPVEILLVDDAPDKLLALEAALSGLELSVVKAHSGNEARLAVARCRSIQRMTDYKDWERSSEVTRTFLSVLS